jgi:hypothetical protein
MTIAPSPHTDPYIPAIYNASKDGGDSKSDTRIKRSFASVEASQIRAGQNLIHLVTP